MNVKGLSMVINKLVFVRPDEDEETGFEMSFNNGVALPVSGDTVMIANENFLINHRHFCIDRGFWFFYLSWPLDFKAMIGLIEK